MAAETWRRLRLEFSLASRLVAEIEDARSFCLYFQLFIDRLILALRMVRITAEGHTLMDMDTRFTTERYLEGVERLSSYSPTVSNDRTTDRVERRTEITPTDFGSCTYHEAAIAEAREPHSHRFP